MLSKLCVSMSGRGLLESVRYAVHRCCELPLTCYLWIDPLADAAAEDNGQENVLLLRFEDFDLADVIASGSPLLASGGEVGTAMLFLFFHLFMHHTYIYTYIVMYVSMHTCILVSYDMHVYVHQ